VRTQLVDGLLADLLQDVTFLRVKFDFEKYLLGIRKVKTLHVNIDKLLKIEFQHIGYQSMILHCDRVCKHCDLTTTYLMSCMQKCNGHTL
jgi:hypothetical protein